MGMPPQRGRWQQFDAGPQEAGVSVSDQWAANQRSVFYTIALRPALVSTGLSSRISTNPMMIKIRSSC
jgi:hypothetical protein